MASHYKHDDIGRKDGKPHLLIGPSMAGPTLDGVEIEGSARLLADAYVALSSMIALEVAFTTDPHHLEYPLFLSAWKSYQSTRKKETEIHGNSIVITKNTFVQSKPSHPTIN